MNWEQSNQALDELFQEFIVLRAPKLELQDKEALDKARKKAVALHYARINILLKRYVNGNS